jgi:Flp pilus assembly protein protease CpaA
MYFPAAHLSVATALLVTAALWDVRKRKIPNILSAALGTTGLVARADLRGWPALASGAAAALALIVLLWHAWTRGRIGGGDTKLAAGAAAWIGLGSLPLYLLFGAVSGGVVATICYLRSSRAARSEIRGNLALAAHGIALPEAPIRGGAGRVSVPYGAAVAAAALVVLWAGGRW